MAVWDFELDERRPSVAECTGRGADARAEHAVLGLPRRSPEFSASTPLPLWQKLALSLCVPVIALSFAAPPPIAAYGLAAALAVPFCLIILLRTAALWHVLRAGSAEQVAQPLPEARLPTYALLVPVFREADVAADLVAAMARLDYPHDRLQIVFITEEADVATRAALTQAIGRPHMRIDVVPEGQPRTKPRALNYALAGTRADLIAVFDAEDVPEPDQLRKAAAIFAAAPPQVACLQARLTIYNAEASASARHFALEYAALFDGILPALDRLGLPLPLGGTSNHFRRDVLERVGAWDAFNVTEDADLGFRLARLGYQVSVFGSMTEEEAPPRWRVWFNQRTRWLKGWMQTYLVHMRDPLRLWRELGPRMFAGFQITLGGVILSALVHPWFYILAAVHVWKAEGILPDQSWLWWLCGFNLFAGYAISGLLAYLTARRRGLADAATLIAIALLPLYWLAVSAAAYAAIYDFAVRPYHWRKTMHSARSKHPPTLLESGRVVGAGARPARSAHDPNPP